MGTNVRGWRSVLLREFLLLMLLMPSLGTQAALLGDGDSSPMAGFSGLMPHRGDGAGLGAMQQWAEADPRSWMVAQSVVATTGGADAVRSSASAVLPSDWASSLAVLYPDIAEPYRTVFLQIIEGIEEALQAKVRAYAINTNADPVEMNAQLRRQGVKSVIALGRQGLRLASALDADIAVTVGGVLSVPTSDSRAVSGISLTPDPALLFTRLKSLQPAVKRIWVVYDPRQNDWLIKLAKEAAKGQGLELMTTEVSDLGEAIKAYEQLFAMADAQRDAVWLAQDTTAVDEQTVLPLVLRESWQRNVPVFSSNYVHVKKGVLFALYPNNQDMGRNLALVAQRGVSGDARKGIRPLRDVYSAVNLRTANHMGLSLSDRQQRSFHTVFP